MNKAQKFYIQEHRDKLTARKIAMDLDLDLDVVEVYLKGLDKSKKKIDKTQKVDNSHLIETRTANNKKGVAVMTKAASESADECVKSRRPDNWDTFVAPIK